MARKSITKESPWPTPNERTRNRAAKREAVLSAAVDLFNERGFGATSIDDLAATLGVTKPTIYHYFPTKEDILLECLQIGLDHVKTGLTTNPDDNKSGFERLRDFLLLYAMAATTRFSKCLNLVRDFDLSEDNLKTLKEGQRNIDTAIQKMILDGVADNSIEVTDPKMAVFVVRGALNSISKWFHSGGRYSEEQIAINTVDFLMRGLTPAASKVRSVRQSKVSARSTLVRD